MFGELSPRPVQPRLDGTHRLSKRLRDFFICQVLLMVQREHRAILGPKVIEGS
jgi:hypothetical protein